MSAGSLAKYRGLCVGGPADGVMRDAEADWFLAVKVRQGKDFKLLAFGPGDPMPNAAMKTDQYRYQHTTFSAGGVEFGFWVGAHHDYAFIMRQLVTSYERKESGY